MWNINTNKKAILKYDVIKYQHKIQILKRGEKVDKLFYFMKCNW